MSERDTVNKGRRTLFSVEIASAVLAAMLSILTLTHANWIERIFGIGVDGDSGALEWLIAAGFALVALAFSILARVEWRRTRIAR